MINEVHFLKCGFVTFCYWHYEINVKESRELRNDYMEQNVSPDFALIFRMKKLNNSFYSHTYILFYFHQELVG